MKKLLWFLAIVTFPTIVFAYNYYAISFSTDNAATSTTATAVNTFKHISGKPVAFSCISDTNTDITVSTTAGNGMSITGSKTLFSKTNSLTATTTNFAANVYLWDDTVTFYVDHSLVTNSVNSNSAKGYLILER